MSEANEPTQSAQVLVNTLLACVIGKYTVDGKELPCWCQEGQASQVHEPDCLECLECCRKYGAVK